MDKEQLRAIIASWNELASGWEESARDTASDTHREFAFGRAASYADCAAFLERMLSNG